MTLEISHKEQALGIKMDNLVIPAIFLLFMALLQSCSEKYENDPPQLAKAIENGSIGGDEAEKLISELLKNQSDKVRHQTLIDIPWLKVQNGDMLLSKALKDSSPNIRAEAILQLRHFPREGGMAAVRFVEIIFPLLSDTGQTTLQNRKDEEVVQPRVCDVAADEIAIICQEPESFNDFASEAERDEDIEDIKNRINDLKSKAKTGN